METVTIAEDFGKLFTRKMKAQLSPYLVWKQVVVYHIVHKDYLMALVKIKNLMKALNPNLVPIFLHKQSQTYYVS